MLTDFLAEIRRRRVFRVAAVYLVGAWLVVQVAATVFPVLELPLWTTRLIVVLAILGFPITLALAWAFDVTAAGVERAAAPAAGVRGGRTRVQARFALAAVIVLATASAGWYATTRGGGDLDASLVVVLPFRVSGTDAALLPLGEGMVDLMSIKLQGEAGARTADPRAAVTAWRRAGGEDGALAEKDLLRLSRQLGGARMLTGEIVSAGSRVVLRAALVPVAGGRRVEENVEGAADSITYLVERLVRGLLSRDAGERDDRLALLTTASLPALQQYLIGQSQYRRGNYAAARDGYLAAIEADSTFALAGLGVGMVARWNGGAPTAAQGARAARIVWRAREQLGPVDHAIALALFGSRYPEPQSEAEQCRGWERVLSLAPDRAELMHWAADCTYHFGAVFGDDDHLAKARRLFERAFAADSAFMPTLEHLIEITATQRDTSALRRYADLHLSQDSTSERREFVRWLLAHATGDTITLHEIAQRFATYERRGLILQYHRERSTDVHWAYRVLDATPVPATTPQAGASLEMRATFALADGRQRDVLALAGELDATGDPRGTRLLLMAATYSELDAAAGRDAAARLAQRIAGAPPEQPQRRQAWYVDACMLAQWELWQRDTTRAGAVLRTLDAASTDIDDRPDVVASARVCATMLRGILAWARGAPDLRAHAQRVDSIAAEYPTGSPHAQYVRMAAARLLEAAGEPAAALRALNRRSHMLIVERLQETRHRESGRLAERMGDTERARREYANYLALREREDELGRAASQPVRDALARLTADRASRAPD